MPGRALRAEVELRRDGFALDLSIEVGPGECLALAGPSGSGKTSALRAIAGLLTPGGGRIALGPEAWFDRARGIDVPPERRRCGYLFQDFALFVHLPAWRNVAYGLRGLGRAERRRRALALLERLGVAGRSEARPPQLSGGERQRVALARALAPEPAVLLLDEPLSALDARTRGQAGRELADVLAEAGVPAVLVSHDFADAALFGDRVGILEGGRLVQLGTAAELAASPVNAFVADFTGAVVLTGIARPGPDGATTIELDGGGQIATTAPGEGRVAASVYPWEISIEPPDAEQRGSVRNHLRAAVGSITVIGGRVRLGLEGPQPLSAEITEASLRELGLRVGSPVTASWKATATRISPI